MELAAGIPCDRVKQVRTFIPSNALRLRPASIRVGTAVKAPDAAALGGPDGPHPLLAVLGERGAEVVGGIGATDARGRIPGGSAAVRHPDPVGTILVRDPGSPQLAARIRRHG